MSSVYFGEMQERDRPRKLPAVVTLDRGMIKLVSGTSVLGEWRLSQVVLAEFDDKSVALKVEDDELLLYLQEHSRFLRETEPYRRPEPKRRRPEHEAFRKDTEPTQSLGEEIRGEVSREVSGVADEIRHLMRSIEPGPILWVALAVFVVLVIFLPTLLVGVLLLAGVVSLAVGAIAYADSRLALKIPEPLTPTTLVAVGVLLVVVGIVVGVIR